MSSPAWDSAALYAHGAQALASQLFQRLTRGALAMRLAEASADGGATPAGLAAIVTGLSPGSIGLAVAVRLAAAGRRVVAGAQPGASLEASAAELQRCAGAPVATLATSEKERRIARIVLLPLDLRDPVSVVAFAQAVAAAVGPQGADLLVHSAGVMLCPRRMHAVSRKHAPDARASEGEEKEMVVEEHALINFIMPLRLTLLLRPVLERAGKGRPRPGSDVPRPSMVIFVASCVHALAPLALDCLQGNEVYSPSRAYAQSKLAQVLAVRWLAQHAPQLCWAAVHPGIVNTPLYRHTPWPVRAMQALMGRILLRSADEAAAAVADVADLPGVAQASGSYFEDGLPAQPAPHATNDGDAAQLMEWAHAVLHVDESAWTRPAPLEGAGHKH